MEILSFSIGPPCLLHVNGLGSEFWKLSPSLLGLAIFLELGVKVGTGLPPCLEVTVIGESVGQHYRCVALVYL
jgi:hypothetical protein